MSEGKQGPPQAEDATARAATAVRVWAARWLDPRIIVGSLTVLLVLALSSKAPILFWLTTLAAGPAFLAALLMAVPRPVLIRLAAIVAFAAAVYGTHIALAGWQNPWDRAVLTDDHEFVVHARALAEYWARGEHPNLFLAGPPPYLGNFHQAHLRILGALFTLLGPEMRWGFLLHFVCLLMQPLIVFVITTSLWSRTAQPWRDLWTDSAPDLARPGLIAAALAAADPNFSFWAASLFRDLPLCTFFLLGCALLLEALRTRSPVVGLLFVAFSVWVVMFRAYAGLSLYVGALLFALSHLNRTRFYMGLALTLLAVALLRYGHTTGRIVDQLVHSLTSLAPAGLDTIGKAAAWFAVGLPRLFLAPYAWVPSPETAAGANTYIWLYPGMWLLYLVGYPLALAGLWALVQRDQRLTIIPAASWVACGAILLFVFGGDASRQRLFLEGLVFPLAGIGWCTPPARRRIAFLVVYALVGTFMTVHIVFRLL